MNGPGPEPVKQQLVEAVKAGQELDLTRRPERTLPASDLEDILRDHCLAAPGARVRLRGAVINGDLDLSQVKTSMTLNLTNCRLTKICIGGASLPRFTLRTDYERSRWLHAIRLSRSLIGKEPALITAMLFSFVVIKVIWIARGDIPTALGIFDSAGLATVIAGGLLSAFPLISAIVLGIATFELGSNWRHPRAFLDDKFVVVTGSAAAVGCLFLTPWPVMALGAGLGLAIGFLSSVKIPNGKVAYFARKIIIVILLLVSFLVLNPLLYAVWLPHEILTLANPGRQPSVGYVLSDNNGWVSLLQTGERRIYWFRSEDVKARTLCRATSISWPLTPPGLKNPSSLWNTIFPRENATLPPCP